MRSSHTVYCVLSGALVLTTQTFAAAAEPTTAQVRELAGAVVESRFDPAAVERAQAFLELTGQRIWNYTDDNGATRSVEGIFDAETVRGDQRVLMFTSRRYVPVTRLDAEGKAVLGKIKRLQGAVVRDHQDLQAAIARRAAEEAELARQAEMARLAAEEALKVRRVRLLVDVDVPVVQGGVPTVLNLGAGEVLDLVEASPTAVVVRAAGQLVELDPRVVREVEPQIVLKPAVGVVPGVIAGVPAVPAPVPPPKLDAKIGSYVFPDGRTALLVEDVAVGGLAARYGIAPGEVIERVNDVAVATLDDYRTASLRGGGGLKLSLFDPETGLGRVIHIAPPNMAVPLGVVGAIDGRGEFLISAVTPGSPAERMGLRRNDKIITVNGVQISTPEAIRQVEASSGGVFEVQAVIHGEVRVLRTPR